MSRLAINQYYSEIDRIIQYGGTRKESSLEIAFQNLLNGYCKTRDFVLIPKLDYRTKVGKILYPDGTIKDALRLDWGYWEAKDQYDNLDKEIEKKLNIGYPDDNILFEDSQTAVLIQGKEEKLRVSMRDESGLDHLLNTFINYVRPEVKDFQEAIKSFKEDLPTILNALRDLIEKQSLSNTKFEEARNNFLVICQQSINPQIRELDVREMIIQHILTEDIFINIFNESQFHRENNIASQLQKVIETFFTGTTKRNTLSTVERYYSVIRRTAASIYNHHEKQKFLKAIYENFYKAYNHKAADRLGIVYTPNEIVKFMIESVDYLTHKHFGKLLSDPGVEILDPATGTGTFITELIEHLPKDKLKYKYQKEIHCNEVAILPYYIANLNIEFTYKQKMEEYEEFNHICFVDTLDHTSFAGKQLDLFSMTVENTARIKNQNDREISVIIGNPPYNAKQENFNQNNANRFYDGIDKRIKETYIKQGKAQNQIVVYDMYTRFIRWATDRLHQNGIIAFVSNNSFIDALAYDEFRKIIAQEFNEIWIIDTKGNARTSGERRRQEGGNIFSDQIRVGVAIYFLVRNQDLEGFKVFYNSIEDYVKAEDKKNYIREQPLKNLNFIHIKPDKEGNWINQSNNDFDTLIPLVDKEVKAGKTEEAVFKLFSLGLSTARDEWVYGESIKEIETKIKYIIDIYNNEIAISLEKTRLNCLYSLNSTIKWTRAMKQNFIKGKQYVFEYLKVNDSLYRPFVKRKLYFSKELNEMQYLQPYLFPNNSKNDNHLICFTDAGSQKPFMILASDKIVDYHLVGAACAAQCLPLYRYDTNGNRIDNITDWGLNQFQIHYNDTTITKEDIFHYTYSVLHNLKYRTKYELNLKRDFPRLPFYQNFSQWVNWGKKLMELHINYETINPYPLKRIDIPIDKPKPKLKADKPNGKIILDDVTTLENIPVVAWEYRLGNRSALEWILDQYKEKKPKDKTIAEKFNTYLFADYKEQVINLLCRVCTVSVETMEIIQKMEKTSYY